MRQPGQRHSGGRQDQQQAAQHQHGYGRSQAQTFGASRRDARLPGHRPPLAHG